MMQGALIWERAKLRETARSAADKAVALIAEVAEKAPDTVITMPFGVTPIPVLRALRLNEYIIHAHDLYPATGKSRQVPGWFLDRGLTDTVTLMQRLHLRSPHKGKSATFHIHRTDGEGEWVLTADGGQAVMKEGHVKSDASLSGPGEGLYWVLMGRGKPADNGVELHGDPALAGALDWANHGVGEDRVMLQEALVDYVLFYQRSPDIVASFFLNAVAGPLSDDVLAGYDAPFPDKSFKAGLRQFTALIPLTKTPVRSRYP